ncbi:MAG TPA: Fe-S-containing protein [Terriglobia bacterium]|nr:Fe-S-containing protein [Terriglobia bacterium]
MFQSLVITLREGVEAALIVGIVLGYLRKTGRGAWNRIVYWALAAALGASLVGALALSRVDVNEEAFEGWLLITGSVFVGSMVVWMWKTGKHLKQEIETKLSDLTTTPSRAAAVGLFLFVFLMVFREGVETVLFLAVVSLRTSELMDFMGGILGLGLAIGLGVALFKGSLKVNLRKFFAVTTLVLMVVAAQLLVAGVHELSEARILPSSRREMALIGPIVNNDAFFFVAIVALCLFLIIAQRFRAGGSEPSAEGLSQPERRKALAEQRRERFWKTAASAVGALIIVLISAEFIYSRAAQAISPPEPVSVANGEVRMPNAALGDHKLHRYVVRAGGADVRFIVILDASGDVHAGLDACQICGAQGYYQDGPCLCSMSSCACGACPSILASRSFKTSSL